MEDEQVEQTEATMQRRAFFKKMAALAFAVPVVSSFTLEGAAFASPRDTDLTQSPSTAYGYNQSRYIAPNQYPNDDRGRYIAPNQYGYNQTK
jgi:hypothetical protein